MNYKPSNESKVFEHVSIDRFTGGAIDAALFQEKAVAKKDKFTIEILLRNNVSDDDALGAFEQSLDDVVKGLLSLGGATTKGYGFFKGEVTKNGEKLELKNEKK